ncbi:hypothetical protein C8R43DRAFT_1124170 [Mycena crocata]|nr:hypothetical protein C8R43DRAFT_1124170 [Mycena crocata]
MSPEIVPMFAGAPFDAEAAVVTPATFVKKFVAHMRDIGMEENPAGDVRKIGAMRNYLVEDSPAERWYDKLKADGTMPAVWDAMETAFLLRFPGPVRAERTGQEWEREMAGMRISLAELGTTVKVGGADVFAHVHFASRLLEVATLAGIETTASGIWQSRDALPEVLREKVPSTQASWTTYTNAIKSVDRAHIREGVAKARKAQDLERTVSDLKARSPPLTPVSKIAVQMSRAALATPRSASAPAHAQVSVEADAFGGGGGGGNLFTPPEMTDEGRAHLRKIVERLTASMLRDDIAGRTEYDRRINGFTAVHGTRKVLLERTGYPLRPGTAPPLSGECFVCGKVTTPWHGAATCPGPRVPPREKIFRGLCKKYLGQPVAVNAVLDETSWMDFAVDDGEEDFGAGLSE